MSAKNEKKRAKRREIKEKNKIEEEKRNYDDLMKDIEASETRTASLDYLSKWKTDKDNWSFSKTRHRWLIKHMYSVEYVPTKSFKIMVKYLQGEYMIGFKKMMITFAKDMMEDDKNVKLQLIHLRLNVEERKEMVDAKKKRAVKILEKLDN
mmetsp:Transcript_15522/g.17245  ORF Transcript_15522/g.17245 Transcript_15522/m.17245 type:complete len:151 (-) Transcript_15522:15-467(-)|eukprot:CAMPEP_0205825088 /NCGR_PEP_ID=MMETSP0206-20130828/23898_1 /ASSEMBLY_ACC=CAM_ASM_000279 /TAXON_ID=36767 /ORGANISM="Euplotes focardii, Strain TN1" /LENGTH=150 /DNA_ID=CAMNT_0053123821 /DNA_START=20 /DNA_END=472 /DNA_ORIENTATION=+